jgi:hypothetical protein
MTESAASMLAEVTTLAGTAHASPLYPPDAPLIRISVSGEPDRSRRPSPATSPSQAASSSNCRMAG